MKKTMKFLMVALIATSLVALGACVKEEVKPDPTPTDNTDTTPDPGDNPGDNPGDTITFDESTTYTIHYGETALAAGDTVFYNITSTNMENDFVKIDFFIENKTEETVSTVLKVEWEDGVQSMKTLDICTPERCFSNQTCPYTSISFTVTPGIDIYAPFSLEFAPSEYGPDAWAVYRVTLGKGTELADPEVIFVHVNLNPSAR